jgi:hypothetical protein
MPSRVATPLGPEGTQFVSLTVARICSRSASSRVRGCPCPLTCPGATCPGAPRAGRASSGTRRTGPPSGMVFDSERRGEGLSYHCRPTRLRARVRCLRYHCCFS